MRRVLADFWHCSTLTHTQTPIHPSILYVYHISRGDKGNILTHKYLQTQLRRVKVANLQPPG